MSRPRGPGAGWTILVTGASSGLGRALALELAREGCALVLTGRDQGRLDTVTAEAVRAGAPWVTWLGADLGIPGGVEGLVSGLRALDRPIDGLVNNAGAGRSGPWKDCPDDDSFVQLLVNSPLALTRALLPGWQSRGRGAVLNVASTGAFQPGPLTSVYYASKAFLASWSQALAREERSWLVVTTLCPGALATGFALAAGKRDVPGAPGPEGAARKAVKAWKKNRGLVVPGLVNKMMVFLSRLAPPAWVAAGVEALQKSVRRDR